jgi:8-oxo-dGTP diphosphatase
MTVPYPRAAVSVVLRWQGPSSSSTPVPPLWLLIQRGREPNKGQWSFPGGKIHLGESTLEAAKRELREETGIEEESSSTSSSLHKDYKLRWCTNGPFACTDSIHHPNYNGHKTSNDNKDNASNSIAYHYVISQCFAELTPTSSAATNTLPPTVTASDDAINAKWWNMEEIQLASSSTTTTTTTYSTKVVNNDNDDNDVMVNHNRVVTEGVLQIVQRSEVLFSSGLL